MSLTKRLIDDIEELISYAVRKGYLEAEEVEDWGPQDKFYYYQSCQ